VNKTDWWMVPKWEIRGEGSGKVVESFIPIPKKTCKTSHIHKPVQLMNLLDGRSWSHLCFVFASLLIASSKTRWSFYSHDYYYCYYQIPPNLHYSCNSLSLLWLIPAYHPLNSIGVYYYYSHPILQKSYFYHWEDSFHCYHTTSNLEYVVPF